MTRSLPRCPAGQARLAAATLLAVLASCLGLAVAEIEASMRADLYRHVQRLPVSFHDRWPAGQLLSRGTTDLQVVRAFLAGPMTFLMVSVVTIVTGVPPCQQEPCWPSSPCCSCCFPRWSQQDRCWP